MKKQCLLNTRKISLNNLVKVCAGGLLLFAQGSYASLITNGGFEDGLAGWTCSVTTSGQCVINNSGTTAREGTSYFGGYENGPAGLSSQSFSTIVGNTYSISFFYGSSTSSPTNNLSLVVGDLTKSFDLQSFAWFSYSGAFTATSTSTSLMFLFDTDPGTGTLWLDGVSVNPIPVPATAWLFGSGLIGLTGLARKRKSA